MNMTEENNSTSTVSSSLDTVELARIKYGILQNGQIFALPTYCFAFWHILTNRVQNNSIHNHVILVLLFFNFIQLIFGMSMILFWLRQGIILPAICHFWTFVEICGYYTSFLVMLWAALERK
jgi:hypothetical protein